MSGEGQDEDLDPVWTLALNHEAVGSDEWCSLESSCPAFPKHELRLTAGNTLSREGPASNPPSQRATSPLSPDGLWPPGGSTPKPCGLLSQAGGEGGRSLGEPFKGLGGGVREEGLALRVGWGEGPSFSDSSALKWPNVSPQKTSPEDTNSLSMETKPKVRAWGRGGSSSRHQWAQKRYRTPPPPPREHRLSVQRSQYRKPGLLPYL